MSEIVLWRVLFFIAVKMSITFRFVINITLLNDLETVILSLTVILETRRANNAPNFVAMTVSKSFATEVSPTMREFTNALMTEVTVIVPNRSKGTKNLLTTMES